MSIFLSKNFVVPEMLTIFAALCSFAQRNKIKKIMNRTIKLKHIMPEVLPQGWKKEVAKMMGVHRNTVSKALRKGSGNTYNRVMHCARIKYGKIVEVK